MADKYTKTELKELEKLRKLVISRTRDKQLRNLFDHLKKWNGGKLNVEEVEEEIIAYRPAVTNNTGGKSIQKSDPALLVVQGYIDQYLKKSDISEKLLKKLSIQIDLVDL